MFTIIYKKNNGYRCSCCGQTWECNADFDSDEEAISGMSKIIAEAETSNYEGWSGIEKFCGYEGDEDALEKKIWEAAQIEISKIKNKKEIKNLESKKKDIESWFENLDQEKATKTESLAKINQQLKQLGE